MARLSNAPLPLDRTQPSPISRWPRPPWQTAVADERFTERQRQVLELLVGGATNVEIADRLTVAETTVKSHVKQIFRKLGASNRAEAIARYLREERNRMVLT
jgi:DNA-binding NarL/FixJ family response regulator